MHLEKRQYDLGCICERKDRCGHPCTLCGRVHTTRLNRSQRVKPTIPAGPTATPLNALTPQNLVFSSKLGKVSSQEVCGTQYATLQPNRRKGLFYQVNDVDDHIPVPVSMFHLLEEMSTFILPYPVPLFRYSPCTSSCLFHSLFHKR